MSATQISDLAYSLRVENLEGTPREFRLGRRDLARMLVIDRGVGAVLHQRVQDLPEWFESGDVLVLNDSKRIPGVLRGRTEIGGQVELRFVELDIADPRSGLCRIFPMHDIAKGSPIHLEGGETAEVDEIGITKHGLSRITLIGSTLRETLRKWGLPILGFFYDGHWSCDELNPYYASEEGTVESPLAGLHFTPELVSAIEATGARVCYITLHSVGSWLPFLEEDVAEHEMWPEQYHVPESTAEIVNGAHAGGGRVFACGSTSLRALESAADEVGVVHPRRDRTSLYINPGYRFRTVDAYFTNFHQQRTSMIVLDAAFGGSELVMRAYSEACAEHYSFFEFGDAVLIV